MGVKVDRTAIERRIRGLAEQMTSLADEIAKCERGEYSVFMADDEFEAVVAEALAHMGQSRSDLCFGFDGPHLCSRCDGVARAWMARAPDSPASAKALRRIDDAGDP